MNAHVKTAEKVELLDANGRPIAMAEETRGQAVALRDEHEASPALSPMQIIALAAKDPSVDPQKMRELYAMHREIQADEAKRAYKTALARLQPELPEIGRNGEIVITHKADADKPPEERRVVQSTPFARWEDIHEAIAPLLAQHGFSLSFKPGVAQDGKVTVTAILAHELGHEEEATVTLPHDSSGSKNPVQAVGSSLSYGKRYAATMILNIRTRGQDDDGEAAWDPADWITNEQLMNLARLMEEANASPERFCDYFEIAEVSELTKGRYGEALKMLAAKKAQGARQP